MVRQGGLFMMSDTFKESIDRRLGILLRIKDPPAILIGIIKKLNPFQRVEDTNLTFELPQMIR